MPAMVAAVRARHGHPVTSYRVVSETLGVVWSGDDPAEAERRAIATAVHTAHAATVEDVPERDYVVSADGELLTVRATGILAAFAAVRVLRPHAIAVTDTAT